MDVNQSQGAAEQVETIGAPAAAKAVVDVCAKEATHAPAVGAIMCGAGDEDEALDAGLWDLSVTPERCIRAAEEAVVQPQKKADREKDELESEQKVEKEEQGQNE